MPQPVQSLAEGFERSFRQLAGVDLSHGTLSHASLRNLLFGLDVDSDPRLSHLRTLMQTSLPDPFGVEGFRQVLMSNVLASRALTGSLIFPRFRDFVESLESIFRDVQAHLAAVIKSQGQQHVKNCSRVNASRFDQFGVSVCTVDGQRHSIGDSDVYFSTQSCANPITYGFALEENGEEFVHQHVGFEPSGVEFNEQVLNIDSLPHNPIITSGAILCASLVGRDVPALSARFLSVLERWTALCGRLKRVNFSQVTFLAEQAKPERNFALAYMMQEKQVFCPDTDVSVACDFYNMMCSIEVTADMLAIVAGTLANGGVNPLTGERIFAEATVRSILSVIASSGMYRWSGEFAFRMGFPAKANIEGAVMIVIPGKVGFCSWSPGLNGDGNSLAGVRFCTELAAQFNFHQYDDLDLTAADDGDATVDRERWKLDPTLAQQHDFHVTRGVRSGVFRHRRRQRRSSLDLFERSGAHCIEARVGAADASEISSSSVLRTDKLAHSSDQVFVEPFAVSPFTPELLRWAAAHDDFDELRRLRAHGAVVDIDAVDYDHRTALHVAAAEGNADFVRALLACGANATLRDVMGDTALEAAEKADHDQAAAVLRHNHQMVPHESSEEGIINDTSGGGRMRNLFRSLDLMGTGRVSVSAIESVLTKGGFADTGAPHTRHIFELLNKQHPGIGLSRHGQLSSKEDRDTFDFREFSRLCAELDPNELLEKVIRRSVVVKDFESFSATITRIFELVEPDYRGQPYCNPSTPAPPAPDLFGISVCTSSGQQLSVGDSQQLFLVQSIAKVVNYCIAQSLIGPEAVQRHVGVEPSGLLFNAISLDAKGLPHNPFINSGAIMTCALIKPELSLSARFAYIENVWRQLTGERIRFDNSAFLGERESGFRNLCLAYLMMDSGAFPSSSGGHSTPDPSTMGGARRAVDDAVELYLMSCSILVTTQSLSLVAATLANGGLNPVTGIQVFAPETARNCLAVAASCGTYDFSGEFAFRIGVPCKSGVGGGLLIMIPGSMGIVTFSPRLDRHGNSVRGIEFCRRLTETYNFHQFDIITSEEKMDPGLLRSELALPTFRLLQAAAADDVVTIRHIIEGSGLSPSKADYDSRTALHLASRVGNIMAVRVLLRFGADPALKDRWGKTAHDRASDAGHVAVCRVLESRTEACLSPHLVELYAELPYESHFQQRRGAAAPDNRPGIPVLTSKTKLLASTTL